VKRLFALACVLAVQAAPALAGDDYYQEPSSSRDYGYVGYGPRGPLYWGGWINDGPAYAVPYGAGAPGYGYRGRAPERRYGYSYGYTYGRAGYAYRSRGDRGAWRQPRCGCAAYDYDDAYR